MISLLFVICTVTAPMEAPTIVCLQEASPPTNPSPGPTDPTPKPSGPIPPPQPPAPKPNPSYPASSPDLGSGYESPHRGMNMPLLAHEPLKERHDAHRNTATNV